MDNPPPILPNGTRDDHGLSSQNHIAQSLVVECKHWRNKVDDLEGLLTKCTDTVLKHIPNCHGDLCVLFSDDKKLQDLNAQFRGRDKPTNVLSFPGEGFEETNLTQLGDIALGFETCEREAHEKQISFDNHTAHLIIHGLLHLCGYDHQTDNEASQMEALEVKILAKMDIDNPYKDEEKL